jgi:hypothetical protein
MMNLVLADKARIATELDYLRSRDTNEVCTTQSYEYSALVVALRNDGYIVDLINNRHYII